MLSVIGGLWLLSGSAPLAAQTAGRSFSPSTVEPGGQVTVTIAVASYGSGGGVTETLPAGFAYGSSSLGTGQVRILGNQMVRFVLQGETSFTYTVTASSTPGSYPFSGTLRDFNLVDHAVGGATSVTVGGASAVTATPVATPVATEEPEESDPPSLADSSIIAAVNGDAAIIDPLAMIIVKDQGSAAEVRQITAQPDATPPVAGFTNPEILNGGPMYTPDGSTEQSPLFAVGGSLAGGYTIGLAGGVNNEDLTSDSYSFQVRIILDEDGTDGNDDNVLERDITLTANVTINVMGVDENDLQFDVVPAKAIKGAVVSGLRRPIASNPLEWDVTGISSSAKLVSIDALGVVGPPSRLRRPLLEAASSACMS